MYEGLYRNNKCEALYFLQLCKAAFGVSIKAILNIASGFTSLTLVTYITQRHQN